MNIHPHFAFTLTAILSLTSASLQAEQYFSQQGKSPALIELFTSQGCSSCPPADRRLNQLLHAPELWKTVVPMAYHVDYWDYLGWRDPLAQPAFTQRQYNYRRAGKLRSVYTPGWLVNGKEWRGYFQGLAFPVSPNSDGGVLEAHLDQQNLTIHYQPATAPKNLTAHVAVLGFDIKRAITTGENKGQTLEHHFVVLYKQQAQQHDDAQWHFTLPVLNPKQRYALAIWINDAQLQPLQAVADWLEP